MRPVSLSGSLSVCLSLSLCVFGPLRVAAEEPAVGASTEDSASGVNEGSGARADERPGAGADEGSGAGADEGSGAGADGRFGAGADEASRAGADGRSGAGAGERAGADDEALGPATGRPMTEEVVTVSSRIDRPLREIGASVGVVTGEEIRDRGYASVMDALRTQTSIGVSNAGGAGKVSSLRIRGEEGYRTLIRIDGIDIADPSRPQVGPSVEHLIATRDIDRIEILRGPQGFIYGADAGGVVNIVSRRGNGDLSGRLGLELGALQTRRLDADVSAGGERGDFLVSVTDFSTGGFNARVSDTSPGDKDGYDNTTAHARLGLNVGENLRLELVARNVNARYEFDQCGFPTTNDCVGTSDQQMLRASADWSASSLTHLVAYSSADTERSDFAAGIDTFSTAGRLDRLEYTGSFTAGPATVLVYGLDFEREDVAPAGGSRLERRQDAYYLEYQGSFGERLFITLGGRRDDNDDFGRHTSVRGTFAYLDDVGHGATLKYRASVGTGFRAPSLGEIAYNSGPFALPPAANAPLAEESSRGYDVGVELTTSRGASYEMTYFEQEIEDEIFFDLIGFSGYLQSLGTTASRGVELVARIPAGERWEFVGNTTLGHAETTEGFDRIRRPDIMANLGFRYTGGADRLRVTGNLRFADATSDEVFGLGRVGLDGYEVLDLSVAYALTGRAEIFGRVENLLDEKYEEAWGFNTSGSAVFGGVRFEF